MPMLPFEEIEITDDDIDKVEQLFGNLSFDEERRQIIKNIKNIDIQAFPGSGKTTTLVAKLAILARKWPYSNKGICVLSHTNAARTEIENRLGNTDVGRRLLSYPHFIGTLHSFFDTFVAKPWLRSNGYPITVIDTEYVLSKRYNQLNYIAKSYIKNKGLSESACEAVSFPIALNLKCKETAPSYINIMNCVKKSFQEGFFTFDEILYVAKYAINHSSYISNALQIRFPLLFIDEAQDTSDYQWDLIESCFNNPTLSLRQAFGDANQAIFQNYNSKSSNHFPEREYLTISSSLRFGESIAHLIDPIGIEIHGLTGHYSKYGNISNKHTIFLFGTDTSKVLPAYAEHLLCCFSDEDLDDSKGMQCYAVGMVHTSEESDSTNEKYPIGVRDYWSDYNHNRSKSSYKPQTLIEYVRIGMRAAKKSGNTFELVESISDGMRWFMIHNTDNKLSLSGKAFNSLCKNLPSDKTVDFRLDLLKLQNLSILNKAEWYMFVDKMWIILEKYFAIRRSENQFFDWTDDADDTSANNDEDGEVSTLQNVFTYTSPTSGRSVHIHLSSIHSEKGKTHLATLVLDTFWYDRNIPSIIPWLCNTPPKKKIQVRNAMRLKCQYVALSRARGLICMALRKDTITPEEQSALSTLGWNIVEL